MSSSYPTALYGIWQVSLEVVQDRCVLRRGQGPEQGQFHVHDQEVQRDLGGDRHDTDHGVIEPVIYTTMHKYADISMKEVVSATKALTLRRFDLRRFGAHGHEQHLLVTGMRHDPQSCKLGQFHYTQLS